MTNITLTTARQATEEVWKDIEGYEEQYKISNLGRVYSCDKYVTNINGITNFVHGRFRKFTIDCNGYITLTITRGGKVKAFNIHRLIAKYFIPNPENKPEVNHKDGNKQNNNLENLEWVTRIENIRHSHYIGLNDKRIQKMSKSLIQKDLSGNVLNEFKSTREAERVLGFDQGNICKGIQQAKPRYGYLWTYK